VLRPSPSAHETPQLSAERTPVSYLSPYHYILISPPYLRLMVTRGPELNSIIDSNP